MAAQNKYSRCTVSAAGIAIAVALLVVGGCAAPVSAPPSEEPRQVNFEGLAEVRTRSLDVAQVRPETDFSAYSGLLLGAPRLAFKTPDRARSEYALTAEQQARFADVLARAFASEFDKLGALELVNERGPGVLELSIRVQDIRATVSQKSLSRVGRGAAFLLAAGDATLVLELSDSGSNELLARGANKVAVEGVATRRGQDMVTTWQDVEVLSGKWASVASKSVAALLERR
jgi:hypothetical protein